MTRFRLQFKALPKKKDEDLDQPFAKSDEDPAQPPVGELPSDEPTDDVEEEPVEDEPTDDAPVDEGDPAEEPTEGEEDPIDEGDPAEPDPNAPQPFAGDVYTEGDETDPAASFAHLKGEDGTEAWLDHSQDGTIVGWVRTPDGTVYRYSDAAAWAIDADDAGMRKIGGSMDSGAPEGEPADEEEPEPEAAEEPPADGEPVDEEEPGLDNRNKRFAFEGKSYTITYS